MDQHFILFFLDNFHHGAINHVIHAIGFTVLGYGLGRRNWWVVILSPFVMEMGHVYNFISGVDREIAFKIIPLQLLAWIIFVTAGYGIAKLLSRSKNENSSNNRY